MEESYGMMMSQPLQQELYLLCQQALDLLGFEPSAPSMNPPSTLATGDESRACQAAQSDPCQSPKSSLARTTRERPTVGPLRHHETGGSLGAQVLPPPRQLAGEPFPLEPMGNPAPEAWSDLTELLHKAKWENCQTPPSDQEARQIRDQWRTSAIWADMVLVGASGPSEPLHRRLVQAISAHICPAIWVDASHFPASEAAEVQLLQPANRLILITPEACKMSGWLQAGIRHDPQGTTWKGRPAVVLDDAAILEQDPARKRALWEGLQAWRRGY